MGRDRRDVLRPARHARRQHGAGQGAVDGRDDPDAGRAASSTRSAWTGTLSVTKQFARFLQPPGPARPRAAGRARAAARRPGSRQLLLSVVGVDRVERMFDELFDPAEFLSPARAARRCRPTTASTPTVLQLGGLHASVDYEPAESTTAMFGGNSNWRGPVWFPVNYLAVAALDRYHRFFGDDLQVEYPTGSGQRTPSTRRRRPARPAGLDLPRRAGRAAARASAAWSDADRPAVARPDPVLRVLRRRQRRRARGRRTRPAGRASSPT